MFVPTDEPGHFRFRPISFLKRLAFFYRDDVERSVIDGLKYIQVKHRICLITCVVMPKPVHVMLHSHKQDDNAPIPISLLLRVFKYFVAFDANARLRDIWRQRDRRRARPLNNWATAKAGDKPIRTTRDCDWNITPEAMAAAMGGVTHLRTIRTIAPNSRNFEMSAKHP